MKVFKRLINVLEAIILVVLVAGVALLLTYKGWDKAVANGQDTWSFIWKNITAFPYDTLHFCLAAVGIVVLVWVIVLIVLSIKKKQAHFYSPLSYVVIAYMTVVAYHRIDEFKGAFSSGNALKLGVAISYYVLFILLVVYALVTSAAILGGPNNSKKKLAPQVEEKEEPTEEAPVEEEPTTEEPEEEVPAEEPTEEEAPAEEPTEEPVEEETPAEEPVKEETPVEELAEEPTEEEAPVEETPVEEPTEESKEEKEEEAAPEVEPVVTSSEEKEESAEEEKAYTVKKFSDKMLALDPEVLQKYSDIKNEFLSYRKIHSRLSKTNDAFRFEGKLVAKICVSGKGLKLYLALDVYSVDSAIYHQRDASSKKKFADTPLVVRVKSPLSYRKALQLVKLACEKAGATKKSRYTPVDFTQPEALMTKKELKTAKEAQEEKGE